MIFLDTNILLEIFFKRKKYDLAVQILEQEEVFTVSFLTVHLFYHFGLKDKYTVAELDNFIENFAVLECNQDVYNLAKSIRSGSDFEDALQVATAIQGKMKTFYTLDEGLAKKYGSRLDIVLV